MWVHLQILAISREHTPGNVRRALAELPKGLDETYTRILKTIAETESHSTASVVTIVLKWILYAEELCSPELITGALTVTPGEGSPDTYKWTVDQILHICHNFVVYDKKLEALRFAHFSIQEFLVRQPEFGRAKSHTTIAEMCLTVLTYPPKIYSCLTPAILEYSTLNWAAHVRLSGGSDVLDGLWKVFLTPSPAYEAWGAAVLQMGKRSRSISTLGAVTGVVPPLWVACYYQLYDIFKFLLEHGTVGAVVDCHNKEMNTPLSHAATKGYKDFVLLLIDRQDVDINSRDEYGLTPLSLAVENRQDMIVQILLEKQGVDLNSRDKDGLTPLSHAAGWGYETIVQMLLEKEGVDMNSRNDAGQTPLMDAVERGRVKVVQIMLEKGVDPYLQDDECRTALSFAVKGDSKWVLQVLLEKGLKPDLQDSGGRTPLSHAAQRGKDIFVKMLLETKAVNPNSQDNHGYTPLAFAGFSSHIAVIQTLLEMGGNPDLPDSKGRTPLSHAAERGHEKVVQVLLENGVDPDSRGNGGMTPLEYAAACGREKIAQILLEKGGADPNSRAPGGMTPSSLAVAAGHHKTLVARYHFPTH